MIPPMAAPPSARDAVRSAAAGEQRQAVLVERKVLVGTVSDRAGKGQRGERGLHAVGPGDDANDDLGKDHGVRGLNRRGRGKGKLELVSAVLGVDLLHAECRPGSALTADHRGIPIGPEGRLPRTEPRARFPALNRPGRRGRIQVRGPRVPGIRPRRGCRRRRPEGRGHRPETRLRLVRKGWPVPRPGRPAGHGVPRYRS